MNLFFKDIHAGQNVTWDNLIMDLKSIRTYNRFCCTADYYFIFRHIILSIILDKEITLLDYDFSSKELLELTGKSTFNSEIEAIDNGLSEIVDKESLLKALSANKKKWKISLFTSGTTGLPKRVSHNFNSITRFVKRAAKHQANIWGFAYNPTHMAGIQVFFQALLNGNSIVRLFGYSQKTIFQEIEDNQITNLSATPTFYRLLLPIDRSFLSVHKITVGGEKFDIQTAKSLASVFPNSKMTNVYASTEVGSLFASDGEAFQIKNDMSQLIKIENDELLINKSLLAESDLKVDEWYHTGDMVKIVSEDPIKFLFLSRENEMINVGGYKINSIEVEDAIRTIKGVKEARIFAKSNSVLGNIICGEIIKCDKKITEVYIRSQLKTILQDFKVPRIITFVEKIELTRTGKIKRKAE